MRLTCTQALEENNLSMIDIIIPGHGERLAAGGGANMDRGYWISELVVVVVVEAAIHKAALGRRWREHGEGRG